MHSLVTGASGYLGRALVEALQSRGDAVVCSYFRGTEPRGCAAACPGDLSDPAVQARLPAILSGVDTVFHLAGIAHQHASAARYRRVNLEATESLATLARDAGVKHFVYVSSIKAQDATTVAADGRLDYAGSKAAAESMLKELFSGAATQLRIVRPALVYGGEESGHLALLRRWVQRRLPRPPEGGSLAMIARDDLVALLCAVVDHNGTLPALITATDGERYSTRRLHRAYCDALGRQPLLPSPPAFLWRAASRLRDQSKGLPAGSTWSRLSGDLYREADGLEALGFTPRLTFERSLGL